VAHDILGKAQMYGMTSLLCRYTVKMFRQGPKELDKAKFASPGGGWRKNKNPGGLVPGEIYPATGSRNTNAELSTLAVGTYRKASFKSI